MAKPAVVKKQDSSMQFQIEVENELQWRGLLRREGLIVIDVYASWAGPCVSMVNILKRVKVEVNDDRLWYGMACSDSIDDLMRFKDQSEPCWLFCAGGKPIRVLRGSHVPNLVNAIKSEFAHELECIEGKSRRNFISIDDEASRKLKIEAEAAKLAQFVVEEEAAESLNEIRRESSLSLMTALEPYTVAIIQPFLVEDGKAKEIVDFLAGDFKIEQQINMKMTEDWARKLYRIPYEVPDPNQEFIDMPLQGDDGKGDDDASVAGGDEDEEGGGKTPKPQVTKSSGRPRRKMLEVPIPEGLVGECVGLLLEHEEIKALAMKKQKPVGTLLETADDWMRLKIGPLKYTDALEIAPYSLHGVYGKGDQLCGVWCPRKYEDKRFAILNFFPTFMETLLQYTTIESGKYSVAIFSANVMDTIKDNAEVQANKTDIVAEGKMKISIPMADEMLKSWEVKGADIMTKKANLITNEVYVVSFNPKNTSLKSALATMVPMHVSKDEVFGRKETSKLFPDLKLPPVEETLPEQVLEKFLARGKPRIPSLTAMDDLGEPVMPEVAEEGESGEGEEETAAPTTATGEAPPSDAAPPNPAGDEEKEQEHENVQSPKPAEEEDDDEEEEED